MEPREPITVREALERKGVDVDALLSKEIPAAANGVIVLETVEYSFGTFEIVIREGSHA